MYELEGMGIRIQIRRKELGLTQGEFADKLNISPQAVSKWETGLGMPDISSLPEIARVLDMSIDELFGRNVPKENQEDKQYPEKLDDDVFITAYGDQALYADRALGVETIDPDHVRFSDGSEVDLNTRVIYNRGIHNIRLVDVNQLSTLPEKEEVKRQELPGDQEVKNLRIDLNNAAYDLDIKETNGPVYWETDTVEDLHIEVRGDELVVLGERHKRSKGKFFFNFGFGQQEKVSLYLPKQMQNLSFKTGGAGDVHCGVNFAYASVNILGAGDMDFNEVKDLSLNIKGAGDMRVRKVGNLDVDISGAGDIDVGEIQGDFSGRIRGAGDINLRAGEVGTFKLTVSGAGDVDASGVTAKELDVGIHGPGSVTLGRLLGSSRENISFMGSLKILRRG